MNREKSDRTAIVHIGSAKTGSASIQMTLSKRDLAARHYIQTSWANHSPMLSLLFGQDETKSAPYFRRQGWSGARMARQRGKWMAELEQEVTSTDKDLIFSAEILCAPVFDEASLSAFKTFLERFVARIQIIGYVRSPVSKLESSFQQRLKGDQAGNLDLRPVSYRKQFSKFARVFGRRNVLLYHYDRAKFPDGDVVLDFAGKIGVDLTGYEQVQANTSPSLQAISILYAQQKLGKPFAPHPGYDEDTKAFLHALASVGSDRMRFGADLLDPVMQEGQPDIAWMEQRLGVPIRDSPAKGVPVISCEDDLLAEAEKSLEQLKAILIAQIVQDAKGPEAVARLADALRNVLSARRIDDDLTII